LFAALSLLDGTVIGRCMQSHRHLEFIRFRHISVVIGNQWVVADTRDILNDALGVENVSQLT
jgi:hypothetical protein